MEGVSLVPAFAGKPLDRKNPIYFAHEGNRAIRTELAADWEAWAKRSDVDPWPGPARDNSGAELREKVAKKSERNRKDSDVGNNHHPAE
jgi:hypothetical protein